MGGALINTIEPAQLCMPASCQTGSRVIPAFSDAEKPFLFSDLAALTTEPENEKGFSTSNKGSD